MFGDVRLAPGSKVGPYEVLDPRLQREVALKVVDERLSGDAAFLARLEQEARLAGSLNHPNIVSDRSCGRARDHPGPHHAGWTDHRLPAPPHERGPDGAGLGWTAALRPAAGSEPVQHVGAGEDRAGEPRVSRPTQ